MQPSIKQTRRNLKKKLGYQKKKKSNQIKINTQTQPSRTSTPAAQNFQAAQIYRSGRFRV
jgi:hypothetical protein